MWRYLMGLVAGVMLVAGGVMWWRSAAVAGHAVPEAPAPAATAAAGGIDPTTPEPPAASERTREQRRFARSDHDKNGQVSSAEFLALRRRNFEKLDQDHDGRLSFDEYAAKAEERFAAADKDKSGALSAPEFASTRAVRSSRPARCPPAGQKEDGES